MMNFRVPRCLRRAYAAIYEEIFDTSQERLQQTLENTLFTYCDPIQAGEIGMHWSFDWLFASREAFALSVGRWYELNQSYCHVTFKHQSNRVGGTKGTGVIYELRLPLHTYRFNASSGLSTIDYEGSVDYQIRRLESASSPSSEVLMQRGWVRITAHKELWRPERRWANRGEMELLDSEGGARLSRWRWDYTIEAIIDRPDYDTDVLLPILEADIIPSGNGHFIPAMRAGLVAGSEIEYEEQGKAPVTQPVTDAYLDGNYGRSSRLDRIVTDRWAWMSAPALWTVDGEPAEHMMTFGFFQKPLIPVIQPPDTWTGAILFRTDTCDMTRFATWNLLDRVEVRFHSPRYLDVTVIPATLDHRVTIRAWSETLTTPLSTPSGRRFHDHQDLLADAYVVIEQNLVEEHRRSCCKPKWRQVARLVTNMFGFEFGEQDRVIGTPGYPAFEAVPEMPAWFRRALAQIPDTLDRPTPSPRLSVLND